MGEFKVHCLFFEGEFCHPGCPNYEGIKKNILKTAKDLNNHPENIAARIRTDPLLKFWTRCQSQINTD